MSIVEDREGAEGVVEELPSGAVRPLPVAKIRRRLGDLLLEAGLITAPQLDAALAHQRAHGSRLGTALVTLGHLSEQDLESSLGRQLGLEVCDVESINPSPEVLGLVSEDIIKQHEVIPLAIEGETLVVGMVDPNDANALDAVIFASGFRRVERRLLTQTTYRRFVATRYATAILLGRLNEPQLRAADVKGGDADVGVPVVVQLASYLLEQSAHQRASDIHIEPYESFFRVRFRVDGCLYTVMTPPPRLHHPLVSRIKILAGMDISERRKPQDGHLVVKVGGEEMHYRVSTLPTSYGEKCVVRLLKKEAHLSDIARLGLTAAQSGQLRRAARLSQGLILVTGPTGSGKTTTVHACVNYINDPEVNIVTIEDPVEQTIPGVNHVQVQEKGGVTFPSALRSILRQDPDVVFVGEMRDPEVANIAVRASLTGHLVLTTLHTNGIVETFSRLADLGVEPYLLASSLQMVLAQRLVRRLCPKCARIEPISADTAREFKLTDQQVATALNRVAVGCRACLDTGYRGRVAVYELLVPNAKVREVLRRGAGEEALRSALEDSGVQWMFDAGIARALAGETSFEEVRRVVAQGDA